MGTLAHPRPGKSASDRFLQEPANTLPSLSTHFLSSLPGILPQPSPESGMRSFLHLYVPRALLKLAGSPDRTPKESYFH